MLAHTGGLEELCKDLDKDSAIDLTAPALIEEGRRLFTEETFDGNGRTCATCHRPERNFTIDAEFIAGLPQDDPLFVHETQPRLRNLENRTLLREFGLFLENLDGFDQRGVFRSANHLLGLSQTISNNETGWSGDGAPGDGSLRCFAVGAVIQHAPKSLDRMPGRDFRLPTDHELDALLAFQLSLGRQDTPQVSEFLFQEVSANRGRFKFFGQTVDDINFALPTRTPPGTRTCSGCHVQAGANLGNEFRNRNRVINANFSPEAPVCRARARGLPPVPGDGGFGPGEFDAEPGRIECSPRAVTVPFRGDEAVVNADGEFARGFFNVQSLFEAADTGPFFHNNIADTLEAAIEFYGSDAFNESAGNVGRAFVLSPDDVRDISAFLRAINALENARSAIAYIEQATGSYIGAAGNSASPDLQVQLLKLALVDTNDGVKVLQTQWPFDDELFPDATDDFETAAVFLEAAINSPESRAASATEARNALNQVSADIRQ